MRIVKTKEIFEKFGEERSLFKMDFFFLSGATSHKKLTIQTSVSLSSTAEGQIKWKKLFDVWQTELSIKTVINNKSSENYFENVSGVFLFGGEKTTIT